MKKFLNLCWEVLELFWYPIILLGGMLFLFNQCLFTRPIASFFELIFGTTISQFTNTEYVEFGEKILVILVLFIAFILAIIVSLLLWIAIISIVRFIKQRKRRH